MNHKTFATNGLLPVPFPETMWIQLHNYLKYVRPQVKPKSPYKQNVFLNASGRVLAKPGKVITKVTKKHDKHMATKIQDTIATVGNEQLIMNIYVQASRPRENYTTERRLTHCESSDKYISSCKFMSNNNISLNKTLLTANILGPWAYLFLCYTPATGNAEIERSLYSE